MALASPVYVQRRALTDIELTAIANLQAAGRLLEGRIAVIPGQTACTPAVKAAVANAEARLAEALYWATTALTL